MTLIKSFVVPGEELGDIGLEAINMHRLGRFVALAGKNGAGKSRLLAKLEFFISARENGLAHVPQRRRNIQNQEQNIAKNPVHPHVEDWKKAIKSEAQQIAYALDRVVTEKDAPAFKSVRFVPKHLNLMDPRQHPSGQLLGKFNQAKSPRTNQSEVCLFYIQQLQIRWWNADHQRFSGSDEEKRTCLDEYEKFQRLAHRMLGVTLGRSVDGDPTFFGKPIPEAGFSDGQKIILQLCVALHAQGSELENTIFLLDEPENHLHPSAVIDVLQILYETTEVTQIWIATHSVPLLAYIASVDPMAIWYVDSGSVTNAGRHPEIVLNSLLGGDERIAQLNAFTGLPAQLAVLNYAVESLLPPTVLRDGSGDAQISQIQSIIGTLNRTTPLTLLDFGAGKGRLLQGMQVASAANNNSIKESLDYLAYDEYVEDKAICQQVIEDTYGSSADRYFNTQEDLLAIRGEKSVDVIVLCNVFHEIAPQKWLELFSKQSLIYRSLRDEGYLLIVEDQRIPTGENAHEYGFLVLDTSHLRTLFSIENEDFVNGQFKSDDKRKDGRLKAHLLGKKLLERVTSASRIAAIEELQHTSENEIRRLRRSKVSSYLNGQIHGFWTQQFANASMFLKDA